MPCVVNFYFRETEQLGKKTENGKRIGGEQFGPKITEKTENNGKSAALHMYQEIIRQKTGEGIDGGLHPAVAGQSPGERWKVKDKT